jgi:hypothetical protein
VRHVDIFLKIRHLDGRHICIRHAEGRCVGVAPNKTFRVFPILCVAVHDLGRIRKPTYIVPIIIH